ncbi:hypothetical protein HPB51_018061 [Rhipicephalus microplus]|uniref:Uncharacterized protein n=1 Tax=Rhipicephalus microplus TaxID=6941 RepID=A0A9J6E347_RHIMP|nr:hypothetical protein HPB51_018061 [Rhipicephalus microplus]
MRRIAPKFGRLPNVTRVASVDNYAPSDLASTIRKIVREELSRRTRATPCEATPLPVPDQHQQPVSIAAAGIEEHDYVSRTPLRLQRSHYQDTRHQRRFSYPRQLAADYQNPNEYAPVLPRPRDAFQNAYRQPPVCYSCGAPGHIVGYAVGREK